MTLRRPQAISTAFLAACRAELRALKPGNVHDFAAGHRMEVSDFERSAIAAAPALSAPGASVGERVLKAAEATLAATGANTNLGIVLLCAPLAASAERGAPPSLRDRLRGVLDALDRTDAALAFRAIAAMNPAGLGTAPAHDVRDEPQVTLLEAMAAAAERDRIARQYATAFEDIFAFALPRLIGARRSAAEMPVTDLHLALLAAFPDSHIARKHGAEIARRVRQEAAALAKRLGGRATAADLPDLLAFDADLKRRGLNPGTTADLVVATLFAEALESRG